MLAPGIIIPFNGLHANIPPGFSRVTAFDGRIPISKNAGVGATGGSDTHTHTTQSHSHSLNSHSHSVTFTDWTGSSGSHVSISEENIYDGFSTHGHGSATGTMNGSPSSSADSPTLGSGSTLPPYYEVIYIQAGGYSLIPDDGIMFTQAVLSNLSLCDGSGGTPNLIGKFLRGAESGNDAGGVGGVTQHSHDASHSHTGASHTHSGTSGGRTGSNFRRHNQSSGTAWASKYHSHPFTTSSNVAPIDSYSGNAGSDVTVYPPYYTLKAYQNVSGDLVPVEENAIALFIGSTLPVGWVLCDGENGTPDLDSQFVLVSSSAGTTEGSSTHTHGNLNHSHNSSAHGHTGTTNGADTGTREPDGGSNATTSAATSHTHALTATDATASYANSDIVIDAGNSIPAYIEAKYIMATAAALGGGAGCVIPNFM